MKRFAILPALVFGVALGLRQRRRRLGGSLFLMDRMANGRFPRISSQRNAKLSQGHRDGAEQKISRSLPLVGSCEQYR